MTRRVVKMTDTLLLPGEVAQLFRVDPKTVTRWAKDGLIGSQRTPRGHHRFHAAEVRKLLELHYTGGNLEERLAYLDGLIAAKDIDTLKVKASGT